MKKAKKQRLEAAGWRVGSAGDFLGLSAQESALIEMKLALADGLKRYRALRGWTQARLAEHLSTSQSRVAKMEAADRSVSIDLLVHALLGVGATRAQVGRIIAKRAA